MLRSCRRTSRHLLPRSTQLEREAIQVPKGVSQRDVHRAVAANAEISLQPQRGRRTGNAAGNAVILPPTLRVRVTYPDISAGVQETARFPMAIDIEIVTSPDFRADLALALAGIDPEREIGVVVARARGGSVNRPVESNLK